MAYSDFSTEEPEAGAGRGFINPPMATGSDVPDAIRKPKRRGGTVTELAARQPGMAPAAIYEDPNIGPALLAGASEGVSAGLAKYPEAAVRSALGNRTYLDEVAAIRARNAALQASNPYAYGTGNVAGAVGLGLATGGGGVAANVGKGALQGATAGYTANAGNDMRTLQDVLTGASLGGGAGALGGFANYATKRLSDSTVNKMAQRYIDGLRKEKITSDAGPVPVIPSTEAVKGWIREHELEGISALFEGMKKTGRSTTGTIKEIVKTSIAPALTGAVVGGGGAAVTGNDIVKGALTGAGTVVAATKLAGLEAAGRGASQATGYAATMYPRVVPRTTAILQGGVIQPATRIAVERQPAAQESVSGYGSHSTEETD